MQFTVCESIYIHDFSLYLTNGWHLTDGVVKVYYSLSLLYPQYTSLRMIICWSLSQGPKMLLDAGIF
jgi:hypothetical protein